MQSPQERRDAANAIFMMGGRQKREADDAESAEHRVQTRRAIELRQEQREIERAAMSGWELEK